jgi:hypothetical protein
MKRIVCLASLACSLALAAQEPDDSRRVVFLAGVVELGSDPALATPALAPTIAAALKAELSDAGFVVLVPGPGEVRDPLDYPSSARAALSRGADALLMGHYSIRRDGERVSLTLGVRAYDLLSERVAGGLLLDGEAGLAVYDTIDVIAASIGEGMRERLPPLTPAEVVIRTEKVNVVRKEVGVDAGVPVTITIRCPVEGARVVAGSTELGTIVGGVLEVRTKAGSYLDFTIVAEGYYPRSYSARAGDESSEYYADWPYKIPAFSIGGALSFELASFDFDSFFGVSSLAAFFEWFPAGDFFYVGAEAGFFTATSGEAEYLELALAPRAGIYPFFGADDPIRFGVFAEVPFELIAMPSFALGVGIGGGLSFELNMPVTNLGLRLILRKPFAIFAEDLVQLRIEAVIVFK